MIYHLAADPDFHCSISLNKESLGDFFKTKGFLRIFDGFFLQIILLLRMVYESFGGEVPLSPVIRFPSLAFPGLTCIVPAVSFKVIPRLSLYISLTSKYIFKGLRLALIKFHDGKLNDVELVYGFSTKGSCLARIFNVFDLFQIGISHRK